MNIDNTTQEKFVFDKHTDYLFQLDHLTTLTVQGDKNRDFLQGQLTCDLREITSTVMRQGALCNLQGRVVALMDVLQQETELLMVIPQTLLTTVQKALNKVAMLSRVTLTPTAYVIYGLWHQNQSTPLPLLETNALSLYDVYTADWGCCYALAHDYYIYLVKPGVEQTHDHFSSIPCYPAQAWHLLQLQQKNLQISHASSGLFLPHRLNLHRTGHIHFQKGCYKGQEIIARMHYRAKEKHEVVLFKVSIPPQLGQKIVDEHQQEMGEIMDACEVSNGQYLIAASMLLVRSTTLFMDDGTPILQSV